LKVAENLDENYKSMIWKKDFIEQVQIDESFKVSVRNNLGFEILSGLSAGESTCLAFAFSLTLSTVAGLNFPIVADSPMGRLSPEVQVELSTVLAAATAAIEPGDENHQLILLMTETEYNEKVAKAFSARRPRVFEILFNTENSEATVREHQ
jgi:DNA sulfur modification protein DndD